MALKALQCAQEVTKTALKALQCAQEVAKVALKALLCAQEVTKVELKGLQYAQEVTKWHKAIFKALNAHEVTKHICNCIILVCYLNLLYCIG